MADGASWIIEATLRYASGLGLYVPKISHDATRSQMMSLWRDTSMMIATLRMVNEVILYRFRSLREAVGKTGPASPACPPRAHPPGASAVEALSSPSRRHL